MPSGEGVDGLIESIVLKTQAVKRRVDVVINGVASELFESGVEFRLLRHQPLEFITLCRGHVFIDLLELRLCRVESIEGAGGSLSKGVARNKFGMLGKMADPDAAGELHRSMVGYEFAGDHSEERALAGSISSDQSNFFTGLHAQRRAVEDDAGREFMSDSGKGKKWHGVEKCIGAGSRSPEPESSFLVDSPEKIDVALSVRRQEQSGDHPEDGAAGHHANLQSHQPGEQRDRDQIAEPHPFGDIVDAHLRCVAEGGCRDRDSEQYKIELDRRNPESRPANAGE